MKAVILILIVWITSSISASLLDNANQFYTDGKYVSAIKCYKKAALKGENPSLCYFNCANAYFQLDSIPQSIMYYQACLANAPAFFRANLNLAIAFYTLNDLGECIATLKRALKLEPNNEKASLVLAASYRQSGAFKEAATLFERILLEHPENEDVYIALGEIYRDLADYHEAIRWLSQYPSTGKKLEYVVQLLADIYKSDGDLDKTLYFLRRAFELNHKNKWVYYRIVMLHQQMGNEFLALEEAKKGLELFPDFADLALFAGNSAFKQQMIDQAERFYTIAEKNGSAGALVGLDNIRVMRLKMAESVKQ